VSGQCRIMQADLVFGESDHLCLMKVGLGLSAVAFPSECFLSAAVVKEVQDIGVILPSFSTLLQKPQSVAAEVEGSVR
jgi:hypothetical protein